MTPIDWAGVDAWLEALPPGDRDYWSLVVERLKPLEALDSAHVRERLAELESAVKNLEPARPTIGQVCQRTIDQALEQLRLSLTGAKFDPLKAGDCQRASHRAKIWREFAQLAQGAMPEPMGEWMCRQRPAGWSADPDWSRLYFVVAALTLIGLKSPELARQLRLDFAQTVQLPAGKLKFAVEALDSRCRFELQPDEVSEMCKFLGLELTGA